jgi:uncharacterized protein (TIRG00374 family)
VKSAKNKLLALVVLASIGFAALIYYQRETFAETWRTLIDADIRYVLLLPLLQLINYFFIGNYYRGMFRQFDAVISRTRAWGVVAAMNFVNQVLPSGGLSGITYLAYGFHSKLATGKTTLIQVGRYMFAFASYSILLPLAVAILLAGGNGDDLEAVTREAAGNSDILITLGVFVAMMLLVILTFVNRKVSHSLGRLVLRLFNWFNRAILRRKNHYEFKLLRKLNSEFHEGAELIKRRGWRAATPGFHMLLSAIVEIGIVYAAVLAVGGGASISAIFLAFVAANIVGVVSIIPGDVGVHEATVIIVLVAFGLDEPAAISATLLYRVFNKAIFLPIGFYFYTKILKPALEQPAS